jgi:uncharacterized protein (DUF427 family)
VSEDTPVIVEPVERRVRVEFHGMVIADTQRAGLLYELRYTPRYYFPLEDVRTDLLIPSKKVTESWCKGRATYWDVAVGERTAPAAAWGYPELIGGCPDISHMVSFVWDDMDHWYEEEEEVFVHPKDKYSRLEILESARHVDVTVDGVLVADTHRPMIAYEGQLVPRYYLPPLDVRRDVLIPSQTRTGCPYKGHASYYSVDVGAGIHPDLVWSYVRPTLEASRIANYLCFFQEHCDVRVDGEPVGHPEGKWLYGGPNASTYTPGDPSAKTGFDDPDLSAT